MSTERTVQKDPKKRAPGISIKMVPLKVVMNNARSLNSFNPIMQSYISEIWVIDLATSHGMWHIIPTCYQQYTNAYSGLPA